jgi:hypothetical protein
MGLPTEGKTQPQNRRQGGASLYQKSASIFFKLLHPCSCIFTTKSYTYGCMYAPIHTCKLSQPHNLRTYQVAIKVIRRHAMDIYNTDNNFNSAHERARKARSLISSMIYKPHSDTPPVISSACAQRSVTGVASAIQTSSSSWAHARDLVRIRPWCARGLRTGTCLRF